MKFLRLKRGRSLTHYDVIATLFAALSMGVAQAGELKIVHINDHHSHLIKRQSQPANSISNPSIACGRRCGVGFWWRDTCDSIQRIILKYGIPSLCQIPMTTLSVFSSLVQQSEN